MLAKGKKCNKAFVMNACISSMRLRGFRFHQNDTQFNSQFLYHNQFYGKQFLGFFPQCT